MSRPFPLIACLLGLTLGLAGCATSEGPELLVIDSSKYPEAFDAADQAVRAVGMPPTLRDRRGGVIETEPHIAGSIFEPWRSDNASFDQALENTVAFQRRRVRVEFTPVGFDPSTSDAADQMAGPDLLGLETAAWDLTRYKGEIELRVWVYLERSYTFGVRRSAWTMSERRQSEIIEPGNAETASLESAASAATTAQATETSIGVFDDKDLSPVRPAFWTPITRDPAFERRLLEEIRKRMDKTG